MIFISSLNFEKFSTGNCFFLINSTFCRFSHAMTLLATGRGSIQSKVAQAMFVTAIVALRFENHDGVSALQEEGLVVAEGNCTTC